MTGRPRELSSRLIIPARARLRLSYTDENDLVQEGVTLEEMIYAVVRYEGDWVRLNQKGEEGFLPQEWAIPLEEAVPFFTRRLREAPDDAYAHAARAAAWRAGGDLDMALEDLNAAVRLQPEMAAWYNNRANVRRDLKEYSRARADYDEALRLNPEDPVAFNNRGALRYDLADYAGARADYDEALRLRPNFAWALNNRAWLLAACPDGKYRDGRRAVADVRRACELSDWQQPTAFLGTLAAAYAEAQDYTRAVHWQKRLADDPRLSPEARAQAQKRIETYGKRSAYHDPAAPPGK
jgi:tetratricopeptide (TPR) repeat protein